MSVTSERYDVIVVGSGSAGATAAISAARAGARTLLVERMPFMGGTSTAVLDTFYAFWTPGREPRRVVAGLGWEVVERLRERGVAFDRPNTYGAGTGVTYDPEILKVVWETLAEEARVELLLHTWATGVTLDRWSRCGPAPLEQGRRGHGHGQRHRRRVGRRGRVRAGGSPTRRARHHTQPAVAVDSVPPRQRRRRAGRRSAQDGALVAHARSCVERRLPPPAPRRLLASHAAPRRCHDPHDAGAWH